MSIVVNGSGTITGISAGGLNDGIVATADIADDAITNAKMANNAIDSAQIASGAVDDAHLATGITASKLTGALPAISGASLTGIATPITALNSATANELVTVGSTTTELDAESKLTFSK